MLHNGEARLLEFKCHFCHRILDKFLTSLHLHSPGVNGVITLSLSLMGDIVVRSKTVNNPLNSWNGVW